MSDSSSQNPSETPNASSSPSLPGPPATSSEPADSQQPSSGGRKKTTRKSNRKSNRSRKSTVAKSGHKRGPASAPTDEASELPKLEPKMTRQALESFGDLAHNGLCEVLGVVPEDWPEIGTLTKKDLDELEGPLTRILNRHRALAPVVERSDEVFVAIKTGQYAFRNMAAVKAARALALEHEAEEIAREEVTQQREEPRKVAPVPAIGRVGSGVRAPGVDPDAGAARHQ